MVVLGLWCRQDFVANVVGEVVRTGWLDTVQCQILGYTQKSGVVVTILTSDACTRPGGHEMGTPWITAGGIGYPGDTCVDGFPSQARDAERYGWYLELDESLVDPEMRWWHA